MSIFQSIASLGSPNVVQSTLKSINSSANGAASVLGQNQIAFGALNLNPKRPANNPVFDVFAPFRRYN
ncbi:hypothetical protein CYY_001027 [Polysphondylium violaceum]|uniref:Uncharacterized protein n=1 Tax=Polysphondylium violaceum TaxID=133409 RepID=A0A8J4V1X7_9MYCE|nr:hypothetical protein CYY_001027 [Polysphondylium violaceum]